MNRNENNKSKLNEKFILKHYKMEVNLYDKLIIRAINQKSTTENILLKY